MKIGATRKRLTQLEKKLLAGNGLTDSELAEYMSPSLAEQIEGVIIVLIIFLGCASLLFLLIKGMWA